MRVALAYGLRPGQIKATVQKKLRDYRDLPITRQEVSVAEKGHRGVAVGPIPGSTPSTEVYVPVNGRVYQINVYGKRFGSSDKELLSTLRFEPHRAGQLARITGRQFCEILYGAGDPRRAERGRAMHKATEGETTFAASSLGEETLIDEGCWQADPDFFFQTQYGSTANADPKDNIPTGWSIVGSPNYWNEYTHGSLDEYGRCNRRHFTNDKFAVDYPLNRGDPIYSPFGSGTVTFAGRNNTHKDYGLFVSIEAVNGSYVNLSGHLSLLAPGIKKGAVVDRHTVIGFAGKSGGTSSRSARYTCTRPTTAPRPTPLMARRTGERGSRLLTITTIAATRPTDTAGSRHSRSSTRAPGSASKEPPVRSPHDKASGWRVYSTQATIYRASI